MQRRASELSEAIAQVGDVAKRTTALTTDMSEGALRAN